MPAFVRRHGATFLVALVTAAVTAGAPALAHLTNFAHLRDHFIVDTVFYRRSEPLTVDGGESGFTQAECPEGTRVVAGGIAGDPVGAFTVESSFPSRGEGVDAGHRAWLVVAQNELPSEQSFRVYAICLRAQGVNSDFPAGATP